MTVQVTTSPPGTTTTYSYDPASGAPLVPAGPGLLQFQDVRPDVPLLTEKDGWNSLPAVRNNRVFAIDASNYTSRSGPRLVTGLEILAEMIHPELFSGMVPEMGARRIYTSGQGG